MGMMGAPGPYGGSYGQCGGQSLGPQHQNKSGQPNSINQFNMDKKPQHGQNMVSMVRELYGNCHSEPHAHTFPDPLWLKGINSFWPPGAFCYHFPSELSQRFIPQTQNLVIDYFCVVTKFVSPDFCTIWKPSCYEILHISNPIFL